MVTYFGFVSCNFYFTIFFHFILVYMYMLGKLLLKIGTVILLLLLKFCSVDFKNLYYYSSLNFSFALKYFQTAYKLLQK